MKIAVVTTFPVGYPTVAEMLSTFDANWPKDVDLFIALDKVSPEQFALIQEEIAKLLVSGREFFFSNEWSPEKEAFFKRNQDSPDVSYRFHVCKFSHKVFALKATADHCKADYDYLIWLDADVITHKPITYEILERELLPNTIGDKLGGVIDKVSYLGRTEAPHSECSFMAFDLKNGGAELITKMHDYYVTDKVLELAGWTDCDVFDHAREGLGRNLSNGLKGWHVFPASPCGKYMEHRKGKLKFGEPKRRHQAVDSSTMDIKTRNCLPNDKILANITENLTLIKHWVDYVQPHKEPVVVCSAGQSLSYAEIKPWADKGTKIITVKHAIDRLKSWGIKPWGCVLLDPRGHVEKFVSKPDKDVIYFVASMVDPSVVKTLLDNDCHVVGYHAFVGAGEDKLLEPGTMLVSGGSATATRCIGLLHECLGFSDIHCYGYDLCYYTKPNMDEKHDDGSAKYLEVTLAANVWGGKPQLRTFWTEGQFLAQAKELHDLYKSKQGFNIELHGQGIAAWQRDCHEQYKAWVDKYNRDIDTKKLNSKTLSEWENGITGKRNDVAATATTNGDGKSRDGFIFTSNAGDTNSRR